MLIRDVLSFNRDLPDQALPHKTGYVLSHDNKHEHYPDMAAAQFAAGKLTAQAFLKLNPLKKP